MPPAQFRRHLDKSKEVKSYSWILMQLDQVLKFMLSHTKTMFIFFLFRNMKKIISLGVLKSIFVTYKTFCCWSIQMIVFVVKLHPTVSDSESEDPPSSEVVNCNCTDNCQAISVSKLLHMPLHSKCQFDAPLSMMRWFLEVMWQKSWSAFIFSNLRCI